MRIIYKVLSQYKRLRRHPEEEGSSWRRTLNFLPEILLREISRRSISIVKVFQIGKKGKLFSGCYERRPSRWPTRRPLGAGDVACLAIYPVRATYLGDVRSTCGQRRWLLGIEQTRCSDVDALRMLRTNFSCDQAFFWSENSGLIIFHFLFQ